MKTIMMFISLFLTILAINLPAKETLTIVNVENVSELTPQDTPEIADEISVEPVENDVKGMVDSIPQSPPETIDEVSVKTDIAKDSKSQADISVKTETKSVVEDSKPQSTNDVSVKTETKSVVEDSKPQSIPEIPGNTSAQGYIESATYLEQQGKQKLARSILKKGYQATKHIDILYQWLTMDEAIFGKLKQKHRNRSITHWQTDFEDNCLKKKHYRGNCSEYDYQKELSHQEKNAIPIVKIEKVRDLLSKYDQLKHSLRQIQPILSKRLLESTDEELKKVQALFNKYQAFIKEMKHTRGHYLSFEVISPYLARTQQLMFVSKIYNPKVSTVLTLIPDQSLKKLHSFDTLREAAIILENVVEQDIILNGNDIVRKQFLVVYKEFKETAGEAKFEEFKAVKKIAHQLESGKILKLGAERW
ncbi:hypothetical protein [Candidatus Parabeggiatoa sp. HSG14]|uniref:hypothetical protein n=1 Tax=Candidatus Parabeggiatoa sp. HSG14 TaxID=3055593 RepID=UPI0025A7F407|nr:hypothetical protein [Thiotrichales bacterium HSG14]